MHRNYEIKHSKHQLGKETEEEKLSPVSLYLGRKHLEFLESFGECSRSESLRRILERIKRTENQGEIND